MYFTYIGAFFSIFFLWRNRLIFVYVIIFCVGAGITTLMSISDGLDPYIFLSKVGKDAVYERRNGRRGVGFPPESAFFLDR